MTQNPFLSSLLAEHRNIQAEFNVHVMNFPHDDAGAPHGDCTRIVFNAVTVLLLAISMTVEMLASSRNALDAAAQDVQTFTMYINVINQLDVAALSLRIHPDLKSIMLRSEALFRRAYRLAEMSAANSVVSQ